MYQKISWLGNTGSRLPHWGATLPSLPRPSPSVPLEVSPLNTARGLGECCKLPQLGLGQSPSGNQIWCILALKSDIGWHQFYGQTVRVDGGPWPDWPTLDPPVMGKVAHTYISRDTRNSFRTKNE